MKKNTFLILVLIIVFLTSCAPDNEMKIIDHQNSLMNTAFVDTVKNCINEEDEGVSLSIDSFSENKSALKSISLLNLFAVKSNVDALIEKDNLFLFSCEKTKYLKKDEIDYAQLYKAPTNENVYLAYNALKKSGLSTRRIEKINVKKGQFELCDLIYNSMLTNKSDSTVETKVIKYLDGILKDNKVYFDDPESVSTICACSFFLLENGKTYNDKEKKLLELISSDKMQRSAIFFDDVIMYYYCNIIDNLGNVISKPIEMEFLSSYIKNNKVVPKSRVYDVTGARNYAAFVLALSFCGIDFSDEVMSALKSIDANPSTKKDDAANYYALLANKYMGNDIEFSYESAENGYFYKKISGEKGNFDSNMKGTIPEKIYQIDVSLPSEEVKKFLSTVDVSEFRFEQNFWAIYNVYVCDLLANGVLDETKKDEIKKLIDDNKCDLGYKNANYYDFISSVYQAHILYIIDKGEDCGFR